MTHDQMTAEQAVDWADSEEQVGYLRLHQRDQWRTSRGSLVAPVLLILIGAFQPAWLHTWGWLIAALVGLGLIALRLWLVPVRLHSFLPASDGLTHYRLSDEDQTLYIQNAAGEHQIPLSQMNKFRSYAAGVVVQYAETSTFTLPDGPVCRELERRLKRPNRSTSVRAS